MKRSYLLWAGEFVLRTYVCVCFFLLCYLFFLSFYVYIFFSSLFAWKCGLIYSPWVGILFLNCTLETYVFFRLNSHLVIFDILRDHWWVAATFSSDPLPCTPRLHLDSRPIQLISIAQERICLWTQYQRNYQINRTFNLTQSINKQCYGYQYLYVFAINQIKFRSNGR